MPKNVVAIGIFGGFGRNQNVIGRREALHPSRIRNPYFINTNAAPKPMMPIATVPISRIFIEKIRAAGIDKVYATTHYLHDIISDYYLEGEGKGLITDLWYEKIPLGTAPGAIMNIMIRKHLRKKIILLFAGDVMSEIDIADILSSHRQAGSKCTVALNPIPSWDVNRVGTALLEPTDGPLGKIKEFREKAPLHRALKSTIGDEKVYLGNSSVYVFDPELFLAPITLYAPDGTATQKTTILEKMFPHMDREFLEGIKKGEISAGSREEAEEHLVRFGPPARGSNDFGFDLFPQLARNGLMQGYYFDRYWEDIKTNEIYWSANWDALVGRFEMDIPFPQCAPGIWRHPSSEVIDLRALEPPVVIGPNVRIDVSTHIGPFVVIDRDWEIEKGARLSYSILWRRFASKKDYPESRRYQVVLSGATVEKSVVGGVHQVGDHHFKIVMADSRAGIENLLGVRSLTPLRIPPGSEAAVAKQTKRLLIVDPDKGHLRRMQKILGKKGWKWLETAATFEEANEKLSANHYDLIILDSNLSSKRREKIPNGIQLLKDQKFNPNSLNRKTPVLLWKYQQDLPGLSSEEIEQLVNLGFTSRRRDSKDIAGSRISDFLLKELLGIDPSV